MLWSPTSTWYQRGTCSSTRPVPTSSWRSSSTASTVPCSGGDTPCVTPSGSLCWWTSFWPDILLIDGIRRTSLIIQGREPLLYLLFIIADWQGFHHQRKRNASPYSENCCIFVREFSFLCKFILRQEILSSLNYSGKLCIHVSCSIYFFLCKFISKSGGNFLVTINHTCESFFIVLFLIQINYNKGKAC